MRYLVVVFLASLVFGIGCEPMPKQDTQSRSSQKLIKASTDNPKKLIKLHAQEHPNRYQKGCSQGRVMKTEIVKRDSSADSTVVRAQVTVNCIRRKSGFTKENTPGYPVYRDYSIQEINEGWKLRLLKF